MAVIPTAAGLALQERVRIAREMVEANILRVEETRTRVNATRALMGSSRPQRDVLHDSAFARLQARLSSMPVIEQAKGILIAESGCDPDEAFDILRRASQRTNVPVKKLAADIVRRAVERGREHNPAGTSGPGLRPLPGIVVRRQSDGDEPPMAEAGGRSRD